MLWWMSGLGDVGQECFCLPGVRWWMPHAFCFPAERAGPLVHSGLHLGVKFRERRAPRLVVGGGALVPFRSVLGFEGLERVAAVRYGVVALVRQCARYNHLHQVFGNGSRCLGGLVRLCAW